MPGEKNKCWLEMINQFNVLFENDDEIKIFQKSHDWPSLEALS